MWWSKSSQSRVQVKVELVRRLPCPRPQTTAATRQRVRGGTKELRGRGAVRWVSEVNAGNGDDGARATGGSCGRKFGVEIGSRDGSCRVVVDELGAGQLLLNCWCAALQTEQTETTWMEAERDELESRMPVREQQAQGHQERERRPGAQQAGNPEIQTSVGMAWDFPVFFPRPRSSKVVRCC